MRESVVRAAVVLGAVAVLAVGCGTAEPAAPAPPPASVVKAPDPYRSAVPAAPQGKPMLTITGRIGVTNVDLTLTDVRDQSIFLATRTGDGAALPVEDGGPTRVVFADDLAQRFSPDLWIWNIETIEVR